MTKIERHEIGSRMSQCVVHGGIAYLAGQIGEGETVTEQTTAALAEIDRVLQLAGTDKTRLLSVQIWLANIDDFSEMNAVWDAWVPKGQTPARATGQVLLASPEIKVEIIVVAAL